MHRDQRFLSSLIYLRSAVSVLLAVRGMCAQAIIRVQVIVRKDQVNLVTVSRPSSEHFLLNFSWHHRPTRHIQQLHGRNEP